MLLSVVVLTLLAVTGASATWSSGVAFYAPDLSPSELRSLYNSDVYQAEKMTRSLSGLMGYLANHCGVRVTLADGSKWLVHKGNDYGDSSDTVVVNARYMSFDWTVEETKNFQGRKTIGDLVAAGGDTYSLCDDNCYDACDRMMEN